MPAPPTQAGIVNAAAARLGSTERIVSLADDAGTLARHARVFWDELLRVLIAEHPWNFAVRRAVLNTAAATPAFGFERGFALPADCARVLPPSTEERDADYWEGEVEGGVIHTDHEGPLSVRYISREKADQVGLWPPHFALAMTLMLAAAMAEPLTGSQSIAGSLQDQAEAALRKAKRRDALENGGRGKRAISATSDWLSAQRMPYQYYGR